MLIDLSIFDGLGERGRNGTTGWVDRLSRYPSYTKVLCFKGGPGGLRDKFIARIGVMEIARDTKGNNVAFSGLIRRILHHSQYLLEMGRTNVMLVLLL